MRRTHACFNNITCLQAIAAYLVIGDINIIGRREVVVITGTEESIAVGHDFQYAISRNKIREIEWLGFFLLFFFFIYLRHRRHLFRSLLLLLERRTRRGLVEHVVVRSDTLVFYREINNCDVICTISWITIPNAVGCAFFGIRRLSLIVFGAAFFFR